MFLEDPQIDLPYSCHAMTRSWLVHGFADQGARLYVGDTLASPSTLFHIDHHADHTHPESEARVGNLAHCAFSSAISGNVRIFGGNPLIWNYQTRLFMGMCFSSHAKAMWSKKPSISPAKIQVAAVCCRKTVKHWSMASAHRRLGRNPYEFGSTVVSAIGWSVWR